MFRDEDIEIIVIPAAPGWYVCVLYAGTDCLSDEPIVAWEIERWADARRGDFCRQATPICTENYFNDHSAPNDGWIDPTGRYHDPDGSKFDAADEALAHLKMHRARRRPPAA